MEKTCTEWGARIERGKVTGTETSGGNIRYILASYDRNGITTPGLAPLPAGETYAEGDGVYFFLYPDGTGRILGRI